MAHDNLITILVPTSPIPSHHNAKDRTTIITQTLKSIRFHFPSARIWIMADGVRMQVEHRRNDYEAYKKQLQTQIDQGQFGDHCNIIHFDTYTQQARMTRETLKKVTTPFIFFCEHDTPLVTTENPRDKQTDRDESGNRITLPEDCKFHWDEMVRVLQGGLANFIRLSFWETLPAPYWLHAQGYLPPMFYAPGSYGTQPHLFVKTTQYSQWPCLATKAFYDQILRDHFHPQAIHMIEIPMASVVGCSRWERFKVVLYYPQPNARRFFHLEGRIDRDTNLKDSVDW